MHILITDDEAPARGELTYILGQLLPDATLYEAKNGQEAVDFLATNQVDVTFLDINMPGMDGLTAGAEIMGMDQPPLIVFATAYSDHAIEAFELAALDYVVKPFDERRLEKTVQRIQETLGKQGEVEAQHAALRAVLSEMVGREAGQPSSKPAIQKLWGERENGNRLLVDYGEILFVEADQKKVFMATKGGDRLQVRQTLKELEERLDKKKFVRVHKAFLINLDHIVEVVPWFSGSYMIKLGPESAEIPMSRRYAAKLKELTDW